MTCCIEAHLLDKDPSLIELMDQGISDVVLTLILKRFSILHARQSSLRKNALSYGVWGDGNASLIQDSKRHSMDLKPGAWERASKSEKSHERRSASIRGSWGVVEYLNPCMCSK